MEIEGLKVIDITPIEKMNSLGVILIVLVILIMLLIFIGLDVLIPALLFGIIAFLFASSFGLTNVPSDKNKYQCLVEEDMHIPIDSLSQKYKIISYQDGILILEDKGD